MGVAASQIAPQLFGMTIGEGCPQESRDSGSIVVCNRTESSLILAQVLKPSAPFLSLRTARLVPGRFVRFRVKKDKNAPITPTTTEPGAPAEKLPPSSGSYQVIASSLQDDTFSQTWFPAAGGDIYALGAAAPEVVHPEGMSETGHPPAGGPPPPVDPFARGNAPAGSVPGQQPMGAPGSHGPHGQHGHGHHGGPHGPVPPQGSGSGSSGFAASFFRQMQGRGAGARRGKPQLPFQLKQKADLLGQAFNGLKARAGHLATRPAGPAGPARKLARS